MDIFDLHDTIMQDYTDYTRSFHAIADERIRAKVEHHVVNEHTLWPDALIQVNPAYQKATTVESLAQQGAIHPTCAEFFRNKEGESFRLYQHQKEALEHAKQQQHYIVTSGTGSGKSLTYFLPIFNAILNNNPHQEKVHAIVVYPMNALVNSQKESLKTLAEGYEERNGGTKMPVTFARYTGQESTEDKAYLQQHPPHILLTNYVMLELMLVRPHEAAFVDRTTTGLQFLVIDELHTYRGRQGADVALLVRRLRERCGNDNLLCIGTSATMASGKTQAERQQAVATFGTTFFGVTVKPEHIIEETLQRIIPNTPMPNATTLQQSIQHFAKPSDWQAFVAHPLSCWIENTFGVYTDDSGILCRHKPISLTEGANKLALDANMHGENDTALCKKSLQAMFLVGSQLSKPGQDPALAFKLHQFIAQGGTVYATIEDPAQRLLTLEGQYYAPGRTGHLLYPLHFCRVCGQEYYAVTWNREKDRMSPRTYHFLPNDNEDDDQATATDRVEGYLMVSTTEYEYGDLEWLPDHWIDARGRIKKEYADYRPQHRFVQPDGVVSTSHKPDSVAVWFMPTPFMLCLSCGEAYTRRDKNDFRKLGQLSSGGRSTSTTLLSIATVTTMRNSAIEREAQKILSFTDNRQDASLQAGHFNDFVQVALLRSALYCAMQRHGTLTFENIAQAVVEEMNLSIAHISRTKDTYAHTVQGQRIHSTFQQVIEYRLYEDLRRGWRIVQPNLEECGMLRVEYRSLDTLAGDNNAWHNNPFMATLDAQKRTAILTTILDEMRRQLAIDVECLKMKPQQELQRLANEYLDEQWAFGTSERLRYAGMYILPGIESGEGNSSLSSRSVVGRWLKREMRDTMGQDPSDDDYNHTVHGIIQALIHYGMLIEQKEGKGRKTITGVQLRPSILTWRPGDGTVYSTPLRRYRAKGDIYQQSQRKINLFFRDFYAKAVTVLRDMKGAEHTAQIAAQRREEREALFGKADLSCLFCSPTMELGVDIATLNAVHLRNVPPTPANYAQRAGRAGRAGQPALVLAYCSFGSGHDHYYFHNRKEMVAGVVSPPRIDLSNEDLIRAHMHAIWLSRTGIKMSTSINSIIDTNTLGYPLKEDIAAQIDVSEHAIQDILASCRQVIDTCWPQRTAIEWYTDDWLEAQVRQASHQFDAAFDRWRDLLHVAFTQLIESQRMQQIAIMGGQPSSKADTYNAELVQREAQRQIELLLCKNTRPEESDFNPYRYLANEGFLPGYNFPSLPVRVYISHGDEGEFIARRRFLALTEFGPGNIIYHEGASYQVQKAWLPAKEAEKRFTSAKLCQRCGHIHQGSQHDICEHCSANLTGNDGQTITSLLEMPTMGTHHRARITCDEEERTRQGYEVTTHFHFAPTPEGDTRRRLAVVYASEGDAPGEGEDAKKGIVNLIYAPATDVWRINHGWRRSKDNDEGFRLRTNDGRWVGRKEEQSVVSIGTEPTVRSNVRVFVRITANVLLLTPPDRSIMSGFDGHCDGDIDDGGTFDNESQLSSLQYALARGMQEYFQVESNELASERIGKGSRRSILFYEDAEGGLGILRRVVEEPNAMRNIARLALAALHFDPDTGDDQKSTDCAFACYDCLLSYYNQRDHDKLNRHSVRDIVCELAQSTTHMGSTKRTYQEQYAWLIEHSDPRSELERHVLEQLYSTKKRLPDYAQHHIPNVASTVPDFFYTPNICVFCDGSAHDTPEQQNEDTQKRNELKEHGYRVVVIRYDRDLAEQVQALP